MVLFSNLNSTWKQLNNPRNKCPCSVFLPVSVPNIFDQLIRLFWGDSDRSFPYYFQFNELLVILYCKVVTICTSTIAITYTTWVLVPHNVFFNLVYIVEYIHKTSLNNWYLLWRQFISNGVIERYVASVFEATLLNWERKLLRNYYKCLLESNSYVH